MIGRGRSAIGAGNSAGFTCGASSRLLARVAMGEMNPQLAGLQLELNAREVATLAPLALLALCLGLYPEYVLSYLRAPVSQLLAAGVTP